MSSAERDARLNSRSRSCAGQERALGSGCPCRPPSPAPAAVPHAGQCGRHDERHARCRRAARRPAPTISGMTSPALRSTTVSPISTPLRSTSYWLCSVACSTVDPATLTGSITPNGVTRPVRPTLTRMSSSLVLTSSGGYLNAIAHRGARLVEPSRRCSCELVDLDHDAVDLVLDVVPVLAVVVDVVLDAGEVVDHSHPVGDRQTPAAEQLVPPDCLVTAGPPSTCRRRAPRATGAGWR